MPLENMNCYARKYGNCSSTSSGEHYISRTVLEQIGGKAVTVSGFPFSPEDNTFGISALTGKILCSNHNSQLADLDAEGGRFFSAIHRFNEGLSANDSMEETEIFNGPLLERFLIKIALGLIASGNMKNMKTGVSPIILEPWIDLLFAKYGFGDFGDVALLDSNQVGLHIIPSNSVGLGKIFYCTPLILPTQDIAHAWQFLVAGLPLALNLGKLDWIKGDRQWIYHPSQISFARDSTLKTLLLNWGESPFTKECVTFTFQGTGNVHPLLSVPPKDRATFSL